MSPTDIFVDHLKKTVCNFFALNINVSTQDVSTGQVGLLHSS